MFISFHLNLLFIETKILTVCSALPPGVLKFRAQPVDSPHLFIKARTGSENRHKERIFFSLKIFHLKFSIIIISDQLVCLLKKSRLPSGVQAKLA
jgi:hypothetical protein